MDFVCENCGMECSEREEDSKFSIILPVFSYDNVHPCLCAECAEQAINEYETEVYYDQCVRCGANFDYGEEAATFEEETDRQIYDIYLDHGVLCCKCAEDVLDEMDD